MENLFLKFNPGKSKFIISYGQKILFLGSCFSEEMACRARNSGFLSYSNPLGTIFHPLPIARFLKYCISNENQGNIFGVGDQFYSWDASSKLYARSASEIQMKLNAIYIDWRNFLADNSVLFITLGTSWGYRLANGLLVANCHKQAHDNFTKELTDIEVLEREWRDLLDQLSIFNPDLKVILTVSPVRHIRDGLIQNNQSKAILIELVRRLTCTTDATYFPSYEIIVDQLRDYRFYKSDRVHPSEEAASIVWESFIQYYMDDITIEAVKEVEKYRKFSSHIPKHGGHNGINEHTERSAELLSQLKLKNPNIQL